MDCKYIFLDIDGTLVDFQGKLADSALKALETANQTDISYSSALADSVRRYIRGFSKKWISTARYARLVHMLWQTASA